jgi:dihydroxyacetone kinase
MSEGRLWLLPRYVSETWEELVGLCTRTSGHQIFTLIDLMKHWYSSIFFNSLASVLEEASQKGATTATSSLWIEAMNHALSVLFRYTKARRPSRTLVDPLQAFAESLKDNPSLPEVALQSAKEAVEQTKKMIATAGRAAYIDQEALADKAVPDPGAWGVLCILNSLVQHRES